MKVFIFEDKRAEAEKARVAVEAAGHKAVVVEGVIRLGMSDEEVLATAEYEIEPDLPMTNDPRDFMQLLEIRKDAKYLSKPENIIRNDRIKSLGVICQALNDIVTIKKQGVSVGIITDLMFRFRIGNPDENNSAEGELTPSGLLVMAHAVAHKIPCCICTDCEDDANGHHGSTIGFIYDGYISSMCSDAVFDLIDNKNWAYAIKLVELRAQGGDK